MATISSDAGGARGKKPLSSDIPLVPFLDLLLCCVMFLLVTATWNQLARLDTAQRAPGSTPVDPAEPSAARLTLAVLQGGYELSRDTGERQRIAGHDARALQAMLDDWRKVDEHARHVTVASEDGVRYEAIVTAMDIAAGAGFTRLDLADHVP